MTDRLTEAVRIATAAGDLALDYFRRMHSIRIESKGHQDFVTEADRNVELFIRAELEKVFPEDGIVGEEHAPKPSASGFTWVIDPIDGTANFIKSIPGWVVVLAGVSDDHTQIGVIRDAVHDETFTARRGAGATLNGAPLTCPANDLSTGAVGIGFSNRVDPRGITKAITAIVEEGGVFYRNASGALSLVLVAAGRLVGYVEEHMNAWDCLAGQLIVAEAGGVIETQSADAMIASGGRVIAGSDQVYDTLLRIADECFEARA